MAESQSEERVVFNFEGYSFTREPTEQFVVICGSQEANRREGQPHSIDQRVMPIQNSNLLPHLVRESGLNADRICNIHPNSSKMYKIYDIRQGKRGKKRTIQEPDPDLKRIQKALIPIFERYQLSPFCTATRGSSAVQNAQRHVGAKHILKVDIKECYPSITGRMVFQGLEMQEDSLEDYHDIGGAVWFCLIDRQTAAGEQVAWSIEGILPTGAPTSPILCNIALTPLDWLIYNMLQNDYGNKYTYTRYLDDMIISTKESKRDWVIKAKIENLLIRGGLRANVKKTKWMDARDDDMVVTGVHVYETHGGIPRKFWRNIRSKLQHLAAEGKDLDAETKGCLSYIKSVDQRRYDSLLTYWERRKNYVQPVEQPSSCTQ